MDHTKERKSRSVRLGLASLLLAALMTTAACGANSSSPSSSTV